jgi:hypothetical protein
MFFQKSTNPEALMPEQKRKPYGTFNSFNFNNSGGGGGGGSEALDLQKETGYLHVGGSVNLPRGGQPKHWGFPEPVGRVLWCSSFARESEPLLNIRYYCVQKRGDYSFLSKYRGFSVYSMKKGVE